ncbi:hypothetical protein DFH09DRAFT_1085626 [Mycena vulgaris]|nr:hypothetical protein DFH09DRAFT_1085626 [Mycena vulgaris]
MLWSLESPVRGSWWDTDAEGPNLSAAACFAHRQLPSRTARDRPYGGEVRENLFRKVVPRKIGSRCALIATDPPAAEVPRTTDGAVAIGGVLRAEDHTLEDGRRRGDGQSFGEGTQEENWRGATETPRWTGEGGLCELVEMQSTQLGRDEMERAAMMPIDHPLYRADPAANQSPLFFSPPPSSAAPLICSLSSTPVAFIAKWSPQECVACHSSTLSRWWHYAYVPQRLLDDESLCFYLGTGETYRKGVASGRARRLTRPAHRCIDRPTITPLEVLRTLDAVKPRLASGERATFTRFAAVPPGCYGLRTASQPPNQIGAKEWCGLPCLAREIWKVIASRAYGLTRHTARCKVCSVDPVKVKDAWDSPRARKICDASGGTYEPRAETRQSGPKKMR